MKTEWDYSKLANAYLERPDYAVSALDRLFEICGIKASQKACDVGAGVAHLTLHLANKGLEVVAVEPNDAMRANGIRRTADFSNVTWVEATSHDTKQSNNAFDLVTFGSSFNVADRTQTMVETYRILKPKAWFFCLWNHRDLSDPVQKQIEKIIQSFVPEYGYGVRREDQMECIRNDGHFVDVQYVEGTVIHQQSHQDCVEAWRSHATLERQAKDKFSTVIAAIEDYLKTLPPTPLNVPYTTRAWVAQRKD